MRLQVWIFLRLVWSEWASRVTGSISAVLVLLALGMSALRIFGYSFPAVSIIEMATWVLAAVCGGQAAFFVWRREWFARNEAEVKLSVSRRFEILFNDADPAFVRPIMPAFRDNIVGERYLVAIHNSAVTTLYHVTLRGKESGFVSRTLAIIHARPTEYGLREDREPVIAILEHLDPGATEFIELFQIRYRAADEVFQDIHRFVLEARARDTATMLAEFEYDPKRRPMIRMISHGKASALSASR